MDEDPWWATLLFLVGFLLAAFAPLMLVMLSDTFLSGWTAGFITSVCIGLLILWDHKATAARR